MNKDELFQEIESIRFSTEMDLLGGFRVLLRLLDEDDSLAQLIKIMNDAPEASDQIYERILTLLPENDKPEYAHPHDAALAGYLYVLSQTDAALAQQAIEAILSTPQLWWAARLARHLQENAVLQPGAKD
jgi:hypothetical protein